MYLKIKTLALDSEFNRKKGELKNKGISHDIIENKGKSK
jgi:hypothetical protein